MFFLKTHLTELLDEKQFVGWLVARAKSNFAALEVVGGLTACTKLGNGPTPQVPDIMKGLGAIAEVE